ncbi:MAG TPA: BON domain-containing protein [Pyrinomonadaceae bacterium]|nr:BON domain-containing protein [Pyrinomonadaceae bacterium]
MPRSYRDKDYGFEDLDYDRDQSSERSWRRRRYNASDYEPRRDESSYDYSSRDLEPESGRDYGRRLSTGWDYGTAFGAPTSPRDYGRESYGRRSMETDRPSYSPYSREHGTYERDYPIGSTRGEGYGRRDFRGRPRGYGYDPERERAYRERGWWDRVSDEVASWFGDEEAERRRRKDEANDYRGRGPRNYRRSDERIKEDINDRLTDHPQLDASDIEVNVSNREVTLTGSVNSRFAKRLAEDIAESVSGVSDVQNNIRVSRETALSEKTASSETATTAGSDKARARSA